MSRGRPLTVQRVFFAARRVRGERRAAFVERVCRENAELRAQVAELLARADPSTDFLRPATRIREVVEGLDGSARWATELSGRRARRGPPLEAGVRIAERYVIEASIGEGSSGRVYRARDEVLKSVVAVKVLDLEGGEELERLRREAATLRWLRVPGVVNLEDDGLDEGRPYIVTDLVEGTPFPGTPPDPATGRRRWEDIRETAVGVLETLARIHAQGVIHGDLKPANVLVDAKGIATVLDVGIASGPSIDFGESETIFAGTPSYMAPERIGGAPASVATDLYAVGVMLHQALVGVVPHHAASRTELLDRRRLEPAPAIGGLAQGVPKDAARMIDALVAREAKDRPASAYDALDLLEHRRYVRPGDPDYPWLGSRELIDKLVQAAKEGRSMDIWGPPGSGKTRTLKEAAKELEALGRKVVWLVPSTEPFGSLSGLMAHASAIGDSAGRIGQSVAYQLTCALASRVVVIADDFRSLDGASRTSLDAARAAGTLLVSSSDQRRGGEFIRPLRLTDLVSLFSGHERIFHLRHDAAETLLGRTDGLPGEMLEELATWTRAGLATLDGARVHCSRAQIERLQFWSPQRSSAPFLQRSHTEHLGSAHALALDLIAACADRASEGLLASALKLVPEVASAIVRDLADLGYVDVASSGRLRTRRSAHVPSRTSERDRRAIHELVAHALPMADRTRLHHLLMAERYEDIPNASLEFATAAVRLGRSAEALECCEFGLRHALLASHRTTASALVEVGLESALRASNRSALETISCLALARAQRDESARFVAAIARAALDATLSAPRRALASIESIAERLPTGLRLLAESVRVVAARYLGIADEREAITRAAEWLSTQHSTRGAAMMSGWLAWLRYREGRYDDAAQLHLQVRDAQAPDSALWWTRTIDAAESLLETARLEEASGLAEAARSAANRLRLPTVAIRAEYVAASARYRAGANVHVDLETLAATRDGGTALFAGQLHLVAAASAWRRREFADARALAEVASSEFARAGHFEGSMLAHYTRRLAGGPRESEFENPRALRSIEPPGVALQCWIVAFALGDVERTVAEQAIRELLTSLPDAVAQNRRELLSPAEARSILQSGLPSIQAAVT